jgi:hypothetical protein
VDNPQNSAKPNSLKNQIEDLSDSALSSAMITLRMSEISADIFFENLPELISTFSQSYVSKILTMLFKDLNSFRTRFTPLTIERRRINEELVKFVVDHYVSQTGLQFFKSFTNSEVFGNPSNVVNKMSETFYKFVTVSKEKGNQEDAREAFLTIFDAYSQISGNFHHTVLRKFFNEKDLNNW